MRYILYCKVAELPPAAGPFPTPNEHLQMNFYCRLGIFMSAWQFIESGISSVYLQISQPKAESYKGLKAAFYRNTSFNVRLEMTNDVVKHSFLDEALKAEWNELRKTLRAHSEKRNKVAHGSVYWAPYEETLPDNQMFVGENLDNPKNSSTGTRHYFAELEKISSEFEQASGALSSFFLKLMR